LTRDLRAQMRDEVERVIRSTGTTAIFVTRSRRSLSRLPTGSASSTAVVRATCIARDGLRAGDALRRRIARAADFLPGIVTSEGMRPRSAHSRTPRLARLVSGSG
jgi:hypothetical protein